MPVKDPFVIGAVVDLGNCLDLLEAASIRIVKRAHEEMSEVFSTADSAMPTNAGGTPDRIVRRLDCAVINFVHDTRAHTFRSACQDLGRLSLAPLTNAPFDPASSPLVSLATLHFNAPMRGRERP